MTGSGASLAGPALVTLVIRASGAVAAFGAQVLFARLLGAPIYGDYVFLMAWVVLLAIPFGLGLPQAVVRLVAQYRETDEWGALRGLLAWVARYVVRLTLALVVLGVIYGVVFRRGTTTIVMLVGLVALHATLSIQTGIGRGIRRMVLAYAPEFLARPLLMIGALLIGVYALGADPTTELALICTLSAYCVSVLAQTFLLRRNIRPVVRDHEPVYRTAEWRQLAIPLLLIAGFLIILARTDVIMLGLLSESAAVAHYDAAYRTATLASFVLLSVNSIAAPTIAATHAKGDRGELQRVALNAARLSFWPSAVICVVLALAAPHILGIFGEGFTAATTVVYILLAGQLINSSVGSVGNLMTMTGYENQSARIFGVSAALNIVLNVLLIPAFGANGAASASAITMALWNMWMFVFVSRRLGIRSSVFAPRGFSKRG